MGRCLLRNATVVNEGLSFKGGIFVVDGIIADIIDYSSAKDCCRERAVAGAETIDLEGLYLAPGVIDTHVHFREPGAIHKGCIASESAAAVIAYGSCVETWLTCSICAPAEAIMVVSEMGEQWSPHTAPAQQAEIPMMNNVLSAGKSRRLGLPGGLGLQWSL